ncbi:helix-turn-helix domain-containing protein [Anaerospora hongkongensis]|uniref:helix-turn-helix domain-containing protein n=1 Tax=Anaerospora hongkongensis TaxID=244830 RepID=UPI002FDA063B
MFDQYNDILTLTELCEALSIGKTSAYQLLTSGQIKAFRKSRNWKIPKIALQEYVLKCSGLNRF